MSTDEKKFFNALGFFPIKNESYTVHIYMINVSKI